MVKIYEDSYYIITQHSDYKFVPGFYVIKENSCHWFDSKESINRLAELEKKIRDYLLTKGVELVGIYKEDTELGFSVYIIPYHIEVLERLVISPDLYQPFISKYLKFFDKTYKDKVNSYNTGLKELLKK